MGNNLAGVSERSLAHTHRLNPEPDQKTKEVNSG